MNYADPFGVQESTPLSRALRSIVLRSDQQLNWPAGYLGPDYIASINSILPSKAGWNLILPDALGANEGTGFLMVNQGQFACNLNNFAGVQLTVLKPGEAKYVYCEQNTDVAGSWHVLNFGEGTSQADAVELAGLGVIAIGGKLNAAHDVSMTSSNVVIDSAYRSKLLVNNGGSVNINLPQYTEVGNNFFFAVHNGGAGTVNIIPPTSNTVDDYASLALAPNESAFVFCSGTPKWYTVGYGRSTQFQFTKLVKDVSAAGTITLTSAEASNKLLQFVGNPTSDVIVVVPSVVGIYYVQNTYGGPNSLTLKTQTGNGLALHAGDRAIVYCDGVNVVSAQSVAVGVNLSIVDGSLNTPSLAFSSDTNTGLYKSDIHTLGIVSNGVEVARFGQNTSSISNRFGINTTTPLAFLHINAAGAEAFRVQGTNSTITFYDNAQTNLTGYIQGGTKELRHTVADNTSTHTFYVGQTKVLELTSAGLFINGTLSDSAGKAYATTGANTFTGIQVMPVQRGTIQALGNVSGTQALDVSKANTFTMTCTAATLINFTGAPASGQDQTVYIKVTNGANLTWGTMCLFNNSGLKPVPTAVGKDIYAVWYDAEAAAYVVGRAYQDYK